MTDAIQRDAIVRMASDPAFAARVRTEPDAVAGEMGMSREQVEALAQLVDDNDPAGAELLGERLSKSALFGGGVLSTLLGEHAVQPTESADHSNAGACPGFNVNVVQQGDLTPDAHGIIDEGNAHSTAGFDLTPDAHGSYAPPGGGNYEAVEHSTAAGPVWNIQPAEHTSTTDPYGSYTPEQHQSSTFVMQGGPDDKAPAAGEWGPQGVLHTDEAHDKAGLLGTTYGGDGAPSPVASHDGAATHSLLNDEAGGKKPDGDDGPPPKLDAIDLENSRVGQDNPTSATPFPVSSHDGAATHSLLNDEAGGKKPDGGDDGPKPPKLDAIDVENSRVGQDNPTSAAPAPVSSHDGAASHSLLNDEAGGKKPDGGDDGPKPPKMDLPSLNDAQPAQTDALHAAGQVAHKIEAPTVERSLLAEPGTP
jgi:hypothetical protein